MLISTAVDLSHTTFLAATDVSTTGFRQWINDNIVFAILAVIACVVLAGSMRGNFSKVFTVAGLSLVGVAFVALAGSENAANGVGNWLLGLVGIQT